MNQELTTNGVYRDIRSILNNMSHSFNADCFKRADITSTLCRLGYINRDEFTKYDIDRTVSAALKKACYTGLIQVRYNQYGFWRNEYSFDPESAAALEGKTVKKKDTMASHNHAIGIMKREARSLYDNISQLQAEIANVKTLKDYSTKELLDEIQSRVAANKTLA